MSQDFTHFQCPVCGRSVGVKGYNPSVRPLDVLGKSFRGLGRGRGFEVSDEESILHTNPDDPIILKIRERVADVYDMFFEGDSAEERLDRINDLLGTDHETLMEATDALTSRLQDFMEEEMDEADTGAPVSRIAEEDYEYEDDNEVVKLDEEAPISELDDEILRGELEEDVS